jgi:hypothetical protein
MRLGTTRAARSEKEARERSMEDSSRKVGQKELGARSPSSRPTDAMRGRVIQTRT